MGQGHSGRAGSHHCFDGDDEYCTSGGRGGGCCVTEFPAPVVASRGGARRNSTRGGSIKAGCGGTLSSGRHRRRYFRSSQQQQQQSSLQFHYFGGSMPYHVAKRSKSVPSCNNIPFDDDEDVPDCREGGVCSGPEHQGGSSAARLDRISTKPAYSRYLRATSTISGHRTATCDDPASLRGASQGIRCHHHSSWLRSSATNHLYSAFKTRLFHPKRHARLRRARKMSKEHAKFFRDLIASWSVRDLHCLVVEYEASFAVRELMLKAESARYPAPSLRNDLGSLFETSCAVDVVLLYKDFIYPAHKSILVNRCSYFRDQMHCINSPTSAASSFVGTTLRRRMGSHLTDGRLRMGRLDMRQHPAYNIMDAFGDLPVVDVRLSPELTDQVTPTLFSVFLRYLYTGELRHLLDSTDLSRDASLDLLLRVKIEFGNPHPLHYDLYSMWMNGSYADAVLVFLPSSDQVAAKSTGAGGSCRSSCRGSSSRLDLASITGSSLALSKRGDYRGSHLQSPVEEQTLRSIALSSYRFGSRRTLDSARDLTGTVGLNRSSDPLMDSAVEAESGSANPQMSSHFACHTSVLAARSSFFRGIISRKLSCSATTTGAAKGPIYRTGEPDLINAAACGEADESEMHSMSMLSVPSPSSSIPFAECSMADPLRSPGRAPMPLRIEIDESVIPRVYAPVLLHAMYTDQLDLSQVLSSSNMPVSSLSEVQVIASGKSLLSPLHEATELYQISRFLEFDSLAQSCEDLIASSLSPDSLMSVYAWSMEPHGSEFVRRHCVRFLAENFSIISAGPLLFDLDESLLVQTLSSDFVQASELEILQAVVKWGEHQLARRLEEREPNILNGTAHSISRKGVRRGDLSDAELREILSALMPLVRTDYVLPAYHQSLLGATTRGLVPCPPLDMPDSLSRGGGNGGGATLSSSCGDVIGGLGSDKLPDAAKSAGEPLWVHQHQQTNRKSRPRLYMPYFEVAKNMLAHRLAECPGDESLLQRHHPPVLPKYPDTLYMVPEFRCSGSQESLASMPPEELTVPSRDTLSAIQARVAEILRTSPVVKKGLACGCVYHRRQIVKQVRLRVIREAGLIDASLAILQRAPIASSSTSNGQTNHQSSSTGLPPPPSDYRNAQHRQHPSDIPSSSSETKVCCPTSELDLLAPCSSSSGGSSTIHTGGNEMQVSKADVGHSGVPPSCFCHCFTAGEFAESGRISRSEPRLPETEPGDAWPDIMSPQPGTYHGEGTGMQGVEPETLCLPSFVYESSLEDIVSNDAPEPSRAVGIATRLGSAALIVDNTDQLAKQVSKVLSISTSAGSFRCDSSCISPSGIAEIGVTPLHVQDRQGLDPAQRCHVAESAPVASSSADFSCHGSSSHTTETSSLTSPTGQGFPSIHRSIHGAADLVMSLEDCDFVDDAIDDEGDGSSELVHPMDGQSTSSSSTAAVAHLDLGDGSLH